MVMIPLSEKSKNKVTMKPLQKQVNDIKSSTIRNRKTNTKAGLKKNRPKGAGIEELGSNTLYSVKYTNQLKQQKHIDSFTKNFKLTQGHRL